MKKEYYGFYEPTEKEIDKSWDEGIFVFDANALLNLYRYTDSTRKDFLLVISKLRDQLFMPYQVGFEYHSNRHSIIETLNNSHNNLLNSIKDVLEKQLGSVLNQYLRHPSIQIDSIRKIESDFVKKISTELDKQKKHHPDFKNNDDILKQLTELYENKVGIEFSIKEFEAIYTEGKDRYAKKVPPGYKDLETKSKKGEQHIYGDLIIWKELISLAKKEKKEVIFVTDDRKEDWWTIENGKRIRPREELIKEFYDLTGTRILIYNADNFLHYAKQRKLLTKIKETTIKEVKEIRQFDENFISAFDFLKNNEKLNDIQYFSNMGTSSLAQFLKNQEVMTNTSGLFYPINAQIGQLLKNKEILESNTSNFPITMTLADLLKNQEKLNVFNQINEPWKKSILNQESIKSEEKQSFDNREQDNTQSE